MLAKLEGSAPRLTGQSVLQTAPNEVLCSRTTFVIESGSLCSRRSSASDLWLKSIA